MPSKEDLFQHNIVLLVYLYFPARGGEVSAFSRAGAALLLRTMCALPGSCGSGRHRSSLPFPPPPLAALRFGHIDAGEQQQQFTVRKCQAARGRRRSLHRRRRPRLTAPLQPFCQEPEARSIPEEDFDAGARRIAKHKDRPACRALIEHRLRRMLSRSKPARRPVGPAAGYTLVAGPGVNMRRDGQSGARSVPPRGVRPRAARQIRSTNQCRRPPSPQGRFPPAGLSEDSHPAPRPTEPPSGSQGPNAGATSNRWRAPRLHAGGNPPHSIGQPSAAARQPASGSHVVSSLPWSCANLANARAKRTPGVRWIAETVTIIHAAGHYIFPACAGSGRAPFRNC